MCKKCSGSFQPNRRQIVQGATGLAAATALGMPLGNGIAAQGAPIEIDYWNWWDVQRQELMDNIIADFQEEFPDIVVNNVPQTWDRRDEVVTTALAGGDPPEIIMASRQEIVKFADSGAIAPITQFVEAEGLELDRYYPSEIESMWWKDDLYALPMPTAGGETGLYVYNTQLFEEAGLDPESPPETWSELDEATAALTKLADNGALEIPGSNLAMSAPTFLAQLYTNNGTLYSDDLKTITWNSAEGVETLTWMSEYVKRHFGGHQNWLDWMNAIQPGERRFDQGRLAIEFQNVSVFFHKEERAGPAIRRPLPTVQQRKPQCEEPGSGCPDLRLGLHHPEQPGCGNAGSCVQVHQTDHLRRCGC
jgi:ABC-type glycerol-3-phosphate transport system substrate-binding protein